jgi:hypothetical protein
MEIAGAIALGFVIGLIVMLVTVVSILKILIKRISSYKKKK